MAFLRMDQPDYAGIPTLSGADLLETEYVLAGESSGTDGLGTGAPPARKRAKPAAGAKPRVNLMLQSLRVVDNKKMFGAASVHLTTIVVDGRGDVARNEPFWTIQRPFVGIQDGDDPIAGAPLLLYEGVPKRFLNVALLLSRNAQAGRDFAAALRKGLGDQGIGTVANGVMSFTPAGMAEDAAARILETVLSATLAAFEARPDSMIGIHHLSLLEALDFSRGHTLPDGHPPKSYLCGHAVEVAYQVV
jgi:hypothetical protein